MGLFSRWFGKKNGASNDDAEEVQLAFVLLSDAIMPAGDAVVRAYDEFAIRSERIVEVNDDEDDASEGEVAMFSFDDNDASVIAALIPATIPDGEMEAAIPCSISSLGDRGKEIDHGAHLIVTLMGGGSLPRIDRLSLFTSVLAAIVKASNAPGVYWGNAGATHPAQFFMSVAQEPDMVPRIMLWTGVSMASEGEGKISLLSLGMKQLGLPNLLLVSSPENSSNAVETMFDLLAYVVRRGEPLPDGDTVGRTATEKLTVKYVPSPIDEEDAQVWSVELP